jgi:hypothetical protein
MGGSGSFVAGSMRWTASLSTRGDPESIPGFGHHLWAELRLDLRHDVARVGIEPDDRGVEVVRDPHAAERDRDEPRLETHLGRPVGRSLPGSIRTTAWLSSQTTHRLSSSAAMPSGASQTSTVAITSFVVGSTRETVSSPELDTQREPNASVTSNGTAPTATVASPAGSPRASCGRPYVSVLPGTTPPDRSRHREARDDGKRPQACRTADSVGPDPVDDERGSCGGCHAPADPGEEHAERRSPAQPVLDPHPSAVQPDEPLHDDQPQPRPRSLRVTLRNGAKIVSRSASGTPGP